MGRLSPEIGINENTCSDRDKDGDDRNSKECGTRMLL